MAASRFVNVSNEDISQFLEANENKNTARKTSQDVALFKTFLRERKLNEPEELTPLQLDASLFNVYSMLKFPTAWFLFFVILNSTLHSKWTRDDTGYRLKKAYLYRRQIYRRIVFRGPVRGFRDIWRG